MSSNPLKVNDELKAR
jgi:hypothetical protein